jgi:hypothetical protein
MLVRLLLLRRLLPALFWFKMTAIIAFVILFLACRRMRFSAPPGA